MIRPSACRGGSGQCFANLPSVRPVAGSVADIGLGLLRGPLCNDCDLGAEDMEVLHFGKGTLCVLGREGSLRGFP
eukprot:365244-Chlamydomonas_euryale.AAC.16